MAYSQVEQLLTAFEKWIINSLQASYFFYSANPILAAVKLLDNLEAISQ